MLLIFLVFVLSSYVSLRSEFRFMMSVMICEYGSFLHPVFCRGVHVLFPLFVSFVGIVVANTYCVVFLLCFSSSYAHYVASFYGLFICDCPIGIL